MQPVQRVAVAYAAVSTLSLIGLATCPAQAKPLARFTLSVVRQAVSSAPVAVSPDGRYFAIGEGGGASGNSLIRVYERATSQSVRTIGGPSEPYTALAFSGDGAYLAAAGDDHRVRVFDLRNGDKVAEVQSPKIPAGKVSRINAVAFGPGNRELVFADSGLGWLTRYSGTSVNSLRTPTSVLVSPFLSIASDGQGGYIAGDALGRFHILDSNLADLGMADVRLPGPVLSLTITQGRLIAGTDTEVRVFNIAGTGRTILSLGGISPQSRYLVGRGVVAVAPTTTGAYVVADVNGGVREVSTPVVPTRPTTVASNSTLPPTTPVTPPPVNPNLPVNPNPPVNPVTPPVANNTRPTPNPNTKPRDVVRTPPPARALRVTLRQTGRMVGHSEYVNGVAFSPDGQILLSGSRDRTVRLWNTQSGDQTALVGKHDNYVASVMFRPDGKQFLSGGWDNLIYQYDAASRQRIGEAFKGHNSAVLSLAYTPDGSHFASGSNDKTVRVWNIATRTSKASSSLPDAIAAVAFSPDGKLLAGGCLDGKVYIWNAQTLALVKTLSASPARPVFTVTWVNNTTLVSAGEAGYLRQWNTQTGAVAATLLPAGPDIYAVAYSPKTKLLASGGKDKLVRAWFVAGGGTAPIKITPAAKQAGQEDTVRSLAFSADGGRIASGGWDYNILLWQVSLAEPPKLTGGVEDAALQGQ
jgi:WD40 repeat protein